MFVVVVFWFDHFDYDAEGGPEGPINTWVAMKTEDKIRDLLQPGTIDSQTTAMIIVNAIYFKGKLHFQTRLP